MISTFAAWAALFLFAGGVIHAGLQDGRSCIHWISAARILSGNAVAFVTNVLRQGGRRSSSVDGTDFLLHAGKGTRPASVSC
jgi:hypothetical protein